MSIASNTGPLIALAKIDRLTLLGSLFSRVLVPPAVRRELMAKGTPESDRLDRAFDTYISVQPAAPLSEEIEQLTTGLGAGEQQAIALARHAAVPLLIDERLGRAAARRAQIAVTGTVGVLIEAQRRGLVAEIRSLLDDLRQRGYWLSDELLEAAVRLGGHVE